VRHLIFLPPRTTLPVGQRHQLAAALAQHRSRGPVDLKLADVVLQHRKKGDLVRTGDIATAIGKAVDGRLVNTKVLGEHRLLPFDRALGLGIVNSGKSKQYATAVEYLSRAKRCFTVAGLPDCWDQLVDQVRTNHHRKAGFIREFEKVAAGWTPEPEPTFLEKARARWTPPN